MANGSTQDTVDELASDRFGADGLPDVPGEQPSDESIRSHIYQFLNTSPGVDPREVQVGVSGGEVTLTGAVDAVPEKRRVREIAETIPGVRNVVDDLKVRNFVERTDEELTNEILNALKRDDTLESVSNLEIYVSMGEVRLEGTCTTWAERHAISEVVWWVPGVRNVETLIHPTEEEADLYKGETAFNDQRSL